MAYHFSVGSISRRRLDGIITGVAITVRCENADNGNVLGESLLTWYVAKADLPAWPPTKAQARAYIVDYLRDSEPGSSANRAARMKQKTAVIQDDPEDWTEAERQLTVP